MNREAIQNIDLFFPHSPTPRPGERVLWYSGDRSMKGSFIGHLMDGRPRLVNQFGSEVDMPTFDCLRLEDPINRAGPMWNDLLNRGQVFRATPEDVAQFGFLLDQKIPPGPKYFELITEIWYRGYEVFLVGGTVRDVIAGTKSKDVDLVTTMPIVKALPFLKSMYAYASKPAYKHGYVRLGGSPESGDPFIDLKVFCICDLGLPSAKFGADFSIDVEHRDFACNSIFYDPVNYLLIDPTGRGVDEAQNKTLSFSCKPERHSRRNLEKIFIRFFKFFIRGFNPSQQSLEQLKKEFVTEVGSLTRFDRLNYVKTQLLSKSPKIDHPEILEEFKKGMINHGFSSTWDTYFETIMEELLDD